MTGKARTFILSESNASLDKIREIFKATNGVVMVVLYPVKGISIRMVDINSKHNDIVITSNNGMKVGESRVQTREGTVYKITKTAETVYTIDII